MLIIGIVFVICIFLGISFKGCNCPGLGVFFMFVAYILWIIFFTVLGGILFPGEKLYALAVFLFPSLIGTCGLVAYVER